MSKIQDLLYGLSSGARTNKYRVLIPTPDNDGISRKLNILCKSTSIPGRAITPVDVIIKGKKTQLAGETSLEGSWSATFFNTRSMDLRIYFDDWLKNIHDLTVPPSEGGAIAGLDALNGIAGQATDFIESYERSKDKVKKLLDDPAAQLFGDSGYYPYYQRDITVQQLGSNDGDVPFEITLIGCFPTSIAAIDLSDETEGISETQVTFSYTDVLINRSSAL